MTEVRVERVLADDIFVSQECTFTLEPEIFLPLRHYRLSAKTIASP